MDQEPSQSRTDAYVNQQIIVKPSQGNFLIPPCRQRSVSTPELDGQSLAQRSSSTIQALRHALLTLYRLDDFISEPLGRGFFSEVFKVVHKVTGEVMVLKMNTDAENRPNVLRELQLMNRMSHPNILKFLGACVHEGQLHALTEFINGGSLHDLIINEIEELPWLERVDLAADIASGMQHLHSKGLFHRDLTSRNILISVDGRIKKAVIGDFGLATKIPAKNAAALSTVGSPYWMAPECLKGMRYDETADIFSYGILLCEVIARIDANPDEMPRTQNFGLDYVEFSSLVGDCPLHFLYLAFRCCQMDPTKRPEFTEISKCLKTVREHKLPSSRHNPIAVRSHISSGHVRRHIRKFSSKDLSHKRSKSAGQSLDFLKSEGAAPPSATAQCIGEHMTKEDEFYRPCPANTNPFKSYTNFSGGQKIVTAASDDLDISDMALTLATDVDHFSHDMQRKSVSLPARLIDEAIRQFDIDVRDSQLLGETLLIESQPPDEVLSVDSAVEISSHVSGKIMASSSYSKCLNLECAMLFSGLDLIRMNKSQSHNSQLTNPTSDLESEFQYDLEDVLKSCSSSDSWPLDDVLSSTSFNSMNTSQSAYDDPSVSRYLHPTLVEKRRQLRHVSSKTKEKIEELQIKLDQLKLQSKKKRVYE